MRIHAENHLVIREVEPCALHAVALKNSAAGVLFAVTRYGQYSRNGDSTRAGKPHIVDIVIRVLGVIRKLSLLYFLRRHGMKFRAAALPEIIVALGFSRHARYLLRLISRAAIELIAFGQLLAVLAVSPRADIDKSRALKLCPQRDMSALAALFTRTF